MIVYISAITQSEFQKLLLLLHLSLAFYTIVHMSMTILVVSLVHILAVLLPLLQVLLMYTPPTWAAHLSIFVL